jgi:hypothetical protein
VRALRPTGMRPLSRLAVLGIGLAVVAAPVPARGSCAAPALTVQAAADRLQVTGWAFVGGGCQDSCSCSGVGGCERCDCGPPPEPVVRAVVQLLDAQRNVLEEVDVAVDGGRFTAELPASGAGAGVSAIGRTATGESVVAEQPVPVG